MAKEVRPSFTRTGEYQVRKKFRFAGKDYEPGDLFPWRKICCSTRRLRQLYEQRIIDPAGEDLPIEEETPETTADETSVEAADDATTDEEEEDDEESTDDEDSDDDSEDDDSEDDSDDETSDEEIIEFVFDPSIHEVVNPKRGKWYITKDGEVLESIYRKLGLDLQKATEPVKLKVDPDGDLVVVE